MSNKKMEPVESGGFAMLVFVVIIAMSLLFMLIRYSENQKQIADNVREIIKSEKSFQAALLCVGYVSNVLARYPMLNDDLLSSITGLKMDGVVDKDKGEGRGVSHLNCQTVSFDNCGDGFCTYRSIIDGSIWGDENHSRIYIEWRLEEYRFYISKLRFVALSWSY